MLKVIKNLGHIHPQQLDDVVTLPFELRTRGRFKSQTSSGLDVGVFLERGKVLQAEDVLETECGKRIQVKAELEDVIEATTDNWETFSRSCYHLGNRHVPLQIGERWLRFKPDHVLEDMIKRQGMHCEQKLAPFSPENGAYSGGHHHH
ncbi:MAG: urease accessory protein UreE [Kangiellaceae bacterium]|jgi:urease accessory protein|nr:urease accessory protein UreE [Kangiellaceae bacterium]|tara:strand:- start:1684 stop:2127 length:444 start_codon:yes stop_codon:yes gene_type:complete